MKKVNVALLQLCSGKNTKNNLAQIEQQIKQLPDSVKLVLTPENALLFSNSKDYHKHAEIQGMGRCKMQLLKWLSVTKYGS